MNAIEQEHLVAAEETLRQAMLSSDVSTLDALIAPELVFTTHQGQMLSKQVDLDMHRSGLLKLTQLTPSEPHYQCYEHYAVVSVLMQMQGFFLGEPFIASLRYTRIWSASNGSLRVVAGHASALP